MRSPRRVRGLTTTIALLGPPVVTRDGAAQTFDTRKAVALLAHLVPTPGSRPREAVWHSAAPGAAARS
ncbi:MAG TPA: hypothetical protein VF549_04505 [Solirubrobacteraceae bacterium]